MNMKKFKKVHQDEHHSIMRDDQGHELKISHKALSPQMRKQVMAIPMAEGGPVMVQDSTRDFVAGFEGKPVEQKKDDNYSASSSSGPMKHPSPENPRDVKYRDAVRAFNARQAPEQAMAKGGMVKRYAEGTPDAPVSSSAEDTPEQISADAVNAQQQSLDNSNGSINTPMAQSVGHAVGSALKTILSPVGQAVKDSVGAFEDVGGGIANGAKGIIQGVAGQPLQPIPSIEASESSVPSTTSQGPSPASAGPATADPSPQPPETGNPFTGAFKTQIKGIEEEAKAKEQFGAEKAKSLEAYDQEQTKNTKTFDATIAEIQARRQKIQQDLANDKIDPKRFWNEKSTLGKIGTILGLVIGGIGSGLLRQDPTELINKQIDRDIDAQKADLGKKQNLLSAINQEFSNVQEAATVHRMMLNDAVLHQIDLASAKAATPMAQAELLKQKGAFQREQAVLTATFGTQQLLNNPNSNPVEQAKALNTLQLVAPEKAKEYRERFVPGVGIAQKIVPNDVQERMIAMKNFQQQANNMSKWVKQNSGTVLDRAKVNEGKAMAAELSGLYRQATQGGVYKSGEQDFINNIIPDDPSQFFGAVRTLPKLNAIIKSQGDQFNGLKRGYGLPVRQIQLQPPVRK